MEAATQRAEAQRDALQEELAAKGEAAGQVEGLQAQIRTLTADLEQLQVHVPNPLGFALSRICRCRKGGGRVLCRLVSHRRARALFSWLLTGFQAARSIARGREFCACATLAGVDKARVWLIQHALVHLW